MRGNEINQFANKSAASQLTKTTTNEKIKGDFATPFSLRPLKEAKSLNSNMTTFLEELRENIILLFLRFVPD